MSPVFCLQCNMLNPTVAFTPRMINVTQLTSTLSLTSIPPSLSSSSCLWMCRSASKLKRSASPMHGGITMRHGSAEDKKKKSGKRLNVRGKVNKQPEQIYTMITCLITNRLALRILPHFRVTFCYSRINMHTVASR